MKNKAIYTGIYLSKPDHDQRVFMMDPPLEGHQYVCVSARDLSCFTRDLAVAVKIPSEYLGYDEYRFEQKETYIFACDAAGEITDWNDLPGSYRGGMDHAQALLNAGYEIVESAKELNNEEETTVQQNDS